MPKLDELKKYVLVQENECEYNDYSFPKEIVPKIWIADDDCKTFWWPPRHAGNYKDMMLDAVPSDASTWMKVPIQRVLFSDGKHLKIHFFFKFTQSLTIQN